MTAVEFLEKEITEIMSYLEEDGAYAMQGVIEKLFGEKNIIQQAKEMEKEQTLLFSEKYDEYVFRGGSATAEEYYEETFKSE